MAAAISSKRGGAFSSSKANSRSVKIDQKKPVWLRFLRFLRQHQVNPADFSPLVPKVLHPFSCHTRTSFSSLIRTKLLGEKFQYTFSQYHTPFLLVSNKI
ncbi:hypothetical protein DSY3842 [Desulfitobacterium hafniense Y51]|uniref:Uncharacterized protein n=1 Tax=Desulfitobacterium hafniense (strain Y51) TaxID=138119 RepID=Q24QR1_DESHY|nr:hypothetical protein DSY3842 [Desulfitobacterium hafniense Y51]